MTLNHRFARNGDGSLQNIISTKSFDECRAAMAGPKLLTALIQTVDCLEYAVMAMQAPEKSSIRETLQDAKNLINEVKGN